MYQKLPPKIEVSDLDEQQIDLKKVILTYFKTMKDEKLDLHYLECLGFLYCYHDSVEDQIEEFWQLLNPQLSPTVLVTSLLDLLTIFLRITVKDKLEIEEETDENFESPVK